MSFQLVERNTGGWKHYVDQYGNDRFQGPNGQWASGSAWRGSLAHHEPYKEGTGVTPEPGFQLEDFSDKTESYSVAHNWCRNEFGIPIEEYPISDRLSQMEDVTENEVGDLPMVFWSFEYEIHEERDDGSINIYEGRRRTSLKAPWLISTLKEEFTQHYNDIKQLVDSYKDVLVLETCVHFRDV